MNYFSLEISLAAVLPALVLAGYVFYRDRVEKEPWWLLALLFALGAVVYVPGYFACRGIAGGLDALFASHITYDLQGNPTMDLAFNPNSSMCAIEGIISPDGRVLGKMGHTERISENTCVNVDGNKEQLLFKGGVDYFK